MKRERVNKSVMLLVVLFISAVFLTMIRSFLMAIFLAGLFSALAHPVYRRFERWYRGRRALASVTTLTLVVLFVLLPLSGLMGVVANQALKVGNSVKPWVQQQIAAPDALVGRLRALPLVDAVLPYRDTVLQKAGEVVGSLSGFLLNRLSAFTMGTLNAVVTVLVLLYTMFFFLMDGDRLLRKILYYLPLEDRDEQRLMDRFTSVARATLKGTAVIGILQGGLAGAAFAVAGIPSAVFWAVVMVVLSVVPGIGTVLVWLPAAVILAGSGHLIKGVALGLFCALVVGSLDNVLRPILVGKDTQMHELLIFFGTLGGILMFGVTGFIIGPIIAALFVTVWDIYGITFADVLPGSADQTVAGDPPASPPPEPTAAAPDDDPAE